MYSGASHENKNSPVLTWFGDSFSRLHPRLQYLHRHGGHLAGDIFLQFGRGPAGFIGRLLAKKLGIPASSGTHELRVEIGHNETSLLWSRCFNRQKIVLSTFMPVGSHCAGYWLEKTGPVSLQLKVDIIEGGWHWRLQSARIYGMTVPLILFPQSIAYKKIVNENYHFHVGFSIPVLGQLFTYRGDLLVVDRVPD